MKDVARLETMAASSVATAEYARAYEKLQASLGKANPPVSEWSQSNRERLRELPEPSEAAWKSLELEMQRQQQRANQQSQTAQQRFEQAQLLREQETRQRLEEQRLSLDAEEQAARIRELDARTDYLDDAPYYNHVYDNLWWQRGHKWRPGSHIKWRSGLKQEKINHGLSDEFRHLRTTERPARHNGHRR